MPNDPNDLQGEERQEYEHYLDENESGRELPDEYIDWVNQLLDQASKEMKHESTEIRDNRVRETS